MYKYQKAADNTADEIAKTYIKVANYINSEAETIFKTFQTKHKLTEREAHDLINEIKDKDTLNSLKAVAEKITDPEKKKEILKIIEAPAYRFRIARLEALQRNIDSYVNELCQNEIDVTKAHYVELSEKAYNYKTYDIQKNIGVMFPFDRIGRERISEILAYNWSGKLFSERIWGRGNEVNQKLKTEILTGFLTGRSYETTAKEIERQMSSGAMEARRLVRTESTYVANISEIESYKECGVEKFRFVAVLDMKTSELCAEKDGMEFDVENARTGTNVPPLHPWCRSTTVAVIDELKKNQLKRSALDPKTGKYYTVPSDMTYGEWKKSIDERYGKGLTKNVESNIIKSKRNKPQNLLTPNQVIKRAEILAKAPEYSEVKSFQELRAVTNAKIVYDKLPTLVSKDEFQRNSSVILYRGVKSTENKTASDIISEFKNGKLWTGNSGGAIYGNGVYFTKTKAIALDYADSESDVFSVVLKKGAKIADFKQIFEEYIEVKKNLKKDSDINLIIGDCGQYAALKGYDAIAVNNAFGSKHDYIIVLNRGICITEE